MKKPDRYTKKFGRRRKLTRAERKAIWSGPESNAGVGWAACGGRPGNPRRDEAPSAPVVPTIGLEPTHHGRQEFERTNRDDD